jgi:hypothetical protein
MADYDDLTADIQDWMQNHSAELAGERDQIIANASNRISRRLKGLQPFQTETSAAFTVGVGTIAKPSTFISMREWSFIDSTTSKYVRLEYRQESYLRTYWPTAASTGTPKFWGVSTAGTFLVVPTPAVADTYTLEHSQILTVTSTTKSNWITNNHYDLYLKACLYEASLFKKAVTAEAPLATVWEQEFEKALAEVIDTETALEMDGNKA